jgi:hypothetical protein
MIQPDLEPITAIGLQNSELFHMPAGDFRNAFQLRAQISPAVGRRPKG